MNQNEIGRQSAELLKTGKAKAFFRFWGMKDLHDLGNLESASIGVETDTTTVDTNEDDLPIPVKTNTRVTSATIAMVARNHNPVTEIFSLQGLQEDEVQPAGNATAIAFDELEAGKVYYLEGWQNITDVTAFAGGVDGGGAAIADYKLDKDAGFIKIIALPDGVTSGKITFNAAAQTVATVGGFSIAGGVLGTLYIRENEGGNNNGTYVVHKVRVTADGEQGVIQDGQDPLTRSFTLTLEQDETQPANYGLFTYRKHKPASIAT